MEMIGHEAESKDVEAISATSSVHLGQSGEGRPGGEPVRLWVLRTVGVNGAGLKACSYLRHVDETFARLGL